MARVAIDNSVPAYSIGFASALAAEGIEAVVTSDVVEWARANPSGTTVVTVRSGEDLAVLDAVGAASSGHVVVLLEDVPSDICAQIIERDVSALTDWRVDPADIVGVIDAVSAGWVMMPRYLARALVPATDDSRRLVERIGVDGLGLLKDVASGRSVRRVARERGFSERSVYRLLGEIYRALGASSKAEAIAQAAKAGLLDGP